MNLLDLPDSVLSRILGLLNVDDLLTVMQCCKSGQQRLCNDELLWRDRCTDCGVSSLQGWEVSSFRQLFLGLLHPSRNLMGLWYTPDTSCGSLLYVTLRSPVVLGCAVLCTDLTGPAWLRPVFQISCRQSKQQGSRTTCLGSDLQYLGCGACCSSGEHTAHVEFVDDTKAPKLLLGCDNGCNHAKMDFLLRLCNPMSPMPGNKGPAGPAPPGPPESSGRETQVDRRSLLASWLLLQTPSTTFMDGLNSSCVPASAVHTYHSICKPSGQHALEGLWRGLYGAYAVEFVQLHVTDGQLIATKLTGDLSVPAGQVSFEVDITQQSPSARSTFMLPKSFRSRDEQQDAPVEIAVQEQYCGQGQIAQVGYLWPSWTPVQLFVFSKDNFGLLWESLHSFTMFTRLPVQL